MASQTAQHWLRGPYNRYNSNTPRKPAASTSGCAARIGRLTPPQSPGVFRLEARRAEVLALDRFVDLSAVNGDFTGGIDAQTDFVPADIDNRNDEILRIAGNPYHPLSHQEHIPFETSVKDAYLSMAGENGLEGRSTACARGNGMMEIRNSPYRITQPLKRVGKRGEGKWEPISYEQLVDEVVNGGDLFGEGRRLASRRLRRDLLRGERGRQIRVLGTDGGRHAPSRNLASPVVACGPRREDHRDDAVRRADPLHGRVRVQSERGATVCGVGQRA